MMAVSSYVHHRVVLTIETDEPRPVETLRQVKRRTRSRAPVLARTSRQFWVSVGRSL
jgi:hypothetical protein